MTCVALTPDNKRCGREMRVLKSTVVDRNRRSYTFRCPYCSAIRVITNEKGQ